MEKQIRKQIKDYISGNIRSNYKTWLCCFKIKKPKEKIINAYVTFESMEGKARMKNSFKDGFFVRWYHSKFNMSSSINKK